MKNILKPLLMFIFLINLSYNSYCQFVKVANRVIVAGYVFNDDNSESMPYVNVYVKQTKVGTITDTTGYFFLSARLNDTLTFSSLGYHNKYVVLTDTVSNKVEPLIIFMDTRIFELRSVEVVALQRYKQFEYEFTNMRLPNDDYINAYNNFPIRPKDIDYYNCRPGVHGVGVVFSPISALYDAFSKKGKEAQKLYQLKQQDLLNQKIDEKINIRLVMEITGLSLIDANEFLSWCNFSTDLLNSSSEYELISLISHRYKDYLLSKGNKSE